MGGEKGKDVKSVQINVLLEKIVIFRDANDKEPDSGWSPANDIRDYY